MASPPTTQPQPQLQNLSQQEFGTLTEPYRRELQAHCYRMLGSVHDAEDLVQETLLRAWRRRETFAGRAPLRAWLYKIATNLCLDTLEQRPRRTVPTAWQAATPPGEPAAAAITEPIWLEPYPDELLAPESDNPEVSFAQREHISLAFMTALQLLPARQRAVLILRDVLDWQASEVADLLGLTVPAVKSALHRARTTLAEHKPGRAAKAAPQPAVDKTWPALLEGYVRAWETADIDALLGLLKTEATFSMPPTPDWYQGHAAIRALFVNAIFAGAAQTRWCLTPAQANGQPAFGLYRHNPAEDNYQAYGIQVITLAEAKITDIITFKNPALFPFFNLPLSLPVRQSIKV